MRPSPSITQQWAGPAPGWGDAAPLHAGMRPLRAQLRDMAEATEGPAKGQAKAKWASGGRAGVPAPHPTEM